MSKRNSLPKAVLDRVLEIDGQKTTVRDFLNANFYRSREPISGNQAKSISELEIGQTMNIGEIEIKRIK